MAYFPVLERLGVELLDVFAKEEEPDEAEHGEDGCEHVNWLKSGHTFASVFSADLKKWDIWIEVFWTQFETNLSKAYVFEGQRRTSLVDDLVGDGYIGNPVLEAAFHAEEVD